MTGTPYKGGRSIKAPYSTTHLRVPLEIVAPIQEIINLYKRIVSSQSEFIRKNYVNSLEQFSPNSLKALSCTQPSSDLVSKFDYEDVIARLRESEVQVSCLNNVIHELLENQANAKKTLDNALALKPNAGGAIKKEIKKAIGVLN